MEALVSRFHSSGQDQKSFAEANGIGKGKLHSWIKKLSSSSSVDTPPDRPSDFIPLEGCGAFRSQIYYHPMRRRRRDRNPLIDVRTRHFPPLRALRPPRRYAQGFRRPSRPCDKRSGRGPRKRHGIHLRQQGQGQGKIAALAIRRIRTVLQKAGIRHFELPEYNAEVGSLRLSYIQLILLIDGIAITNIARRKRYEKV